MTIPRTRFAPSPTGSLHVGGARTALYCLLYARHHDGRFVLRIEDTDRARSTDAATAGILRDLRWLGLSWDEGPEVGGDTGPYFQSARRELYDRYVQQLLDSGVAYEAWETREELDQLRKAAEAEKRNFRFRRPRYTDEDLARFRAEGRVPVVRLRAPEHPVTVTDRILGNVTLPPEDLEDIVIRKADGFPTYHFAVVVDDHLMGVTQVLRGQEHFMNTHKHMGILEALGWEPPAYAHLPIIMSMGGAKMSKRDKARTAREAARAWKKQAGTPKGDYTGLAEQAGLDHDTLVAFMDKKTDDLAVAEALAAALHVALPMIEVMDFRKAGYLPEALVNYLALLGWSPGDDRELMDMGELVDAFTLDRVGKTSAKFDAQKLEWMNGEYMKRLPDDRLLVLLDAWLEVVDSPLSRASEAERLQLFSMYRQRATTFAKLDEMARFFFERPTSWDAKAAKKHLLKGGGLDRLEATRDAFAALPTWSPDAIEAALQQLADADDGKLGRYAQPVRIAVSGGPVSPGIGETLALVGRDESLARMTACLEAHR